MIIGDINTIMMMKTSDILYELPSDFISNRSNYIDTGIKIADWSAITIALTFYVTNWTNTSINFVYGDCGDNSMGTYQALQTQLSASRRYLWGSGLGWNDGQNFANINQNIKFVVTYDTSTLVRNTKVKNVSTGTTITTSGTFINQNQFAIFIGKQETGVYSGFHGVITDFKIYNRILTSAEIDAYIA